MVHYSRFQFLFPEVKGNVVLWKEVLKDMKTSENLGLLLRYYN